MTGYYLRFVGAEQLPKTLSWFDVEQFFKLTLDDVAAVKERFRADYRLGPALQLVFLRVACRPFDRFVVVPKALLRHVADALGLTDSSFASLRSLYQRRPTLSDRHRSACER